MIPILSSESCKCGHLVGDSDAIARRNSGSGASTSAAGGREPRRGGARGKAAAAAMAHTEGGADGVGGVGGKRPREDVDGVELVPSECTLVVAPVTLNPKP